MFVSDMCVPAMVAAQQSGYGKLYEADKRTEI